MRPTDRQTAARPVSAQPAQRLNYVKAGWSYLSLETSSIPLIPHVPTHTLKGEGKQEGRKRGEREEAPGRRAGSSSATTCLSAGK